MFVYFFQTSWLFLGSFSVANSLLNLSAFELPLGGSMMKRTLFLFGFRAHLSRVRNHPCHMNALSVPMSGVWISVSFRPLFSEVHVCILQVESRLETALKVQKEKAELAALKEGPKPIDRDAASLQRLAENFPEEVKKRKLSTAQVSYVLSSHRSTSQESLPHDVEWFSGSTLKLVLTVHFYSQCFT